jgi:hypothetical protein
VDKKQWDWRDKTDVELGSVLVKKSASWSSDDTYQRETTPFCIWASTPICLVRSCFTGSWAILIAHVLSDKRGVDIQTETPKSSSNHHNQVTSAVTRSISRNSTSALERETAAYFLVTREPPENTIDRKRMTIREITSPSSITEREIGLHLFLNDFGGWIAQHK